MKKSVGRLLAVLFLLFLILNPSLRQRRCGWPGPLGKCSSTRSSSLYDWNRRRSRTSGYGSFNPPCVSDFKAFFRFKQRRGLCNGVRAAMRISHGCKTGRRISERRADQSASKPVSFSDLQPSQPHVPVGLYRSAAERSRDRQLCPSPSCLRLSPHFPFILFVQKALWLDFSSNKKYSAAFQNSALFF